MAPTSNERLILGFFSKLMSKEAGEVGLVDDQSFDDALSLQVVFSGKFQLAPDAVAKTLCRYSKETKKAACKLADGFAEQGTPLGLIGWGHHVVRMVGFDVPMPTEVVELCVAPAHYGQEVKEQVRAHTAHVILYYAGQEESRLEQYVVLAAIAGALAEHGAIAVLNESAHTSLPAAVLGKGLSEADEDALELLRTLPLPMLYIGMVKYDVEGIEGVWMRTYGADLLGLAEFAQLASGHDQGSATFEIFSNIMSYQLSSGAEFAAGHTAQVGEDMFMKLRAPTDAEYFLESSGELYVVEFASAAEMNA